MLRVAAFGLLVRGGRPAATGTLLAAAVVLAAGAATGLMSWAFPATALLGIGWALRSLRLLRLTPLGPNGPAGPGGGTAGVREPRRPRPRPPAGAMALAVPQQPPDDAIVALA